MAVSHTTMLSKLIVALLSAFLSSAESKFCGTSPSRDDVYAAQRQFQLDEARMVPLQESNQSLPIKVYFHVVATNQTLEGGWIPDSAINEQMKVLNDGFNSTGLQWVLAGVDRTINGTWFRKVTPFFSYQDDMKMQLKVGNVSDLDIYTVGFEDYPMLGYSSYPQNYTNYPNDDGIVILHSTLPGGTKENYNLGKTAVHEAGHWAGLYHTFEGGCDGDGDFVDDTPAEKSEALGCPEGRDTCPSPGLDPIHNYMDSTYDSCKYEFTPGQAVRIRKQMMMYRNVSIPRRFQIVVSFKLT